MPRFWSATNLDHPPPTLVAAIPESTSGSRRNRSGHSFTVLMEVTSAHSSSCGHPVSAKNEAGISCDSPHPMPAVRTSQANSQFLPHYPTYMHDCIATIHPPKCDNAAHGSWITSKSTYQVLPRRCRVECDRKVSRLRLVQLSQHLQLQPWIRHGQRAAAVSATSLHKILPKRPCSRLACSCARPARVLNA